MRPNDNVNAYGAVTVIIAIARVHLVYLMNSDSAPDTNHQTKPTDLGFESALSSTFTIVIYYYHLAQKLIPITDTGRVPQTLY